MLIVFLYVYLSKRLVRIAAVYLKSSVYFVVLVAQCRHAVVGRALFWPLLELPSYFVQ